MTTVAQLANRAHRDFAYLLCIQGVPWMFTDRWEIVGTGPGSWIGTDYGPRRVRTGMEVPSTITFETQREDGRPACSDGATFTFQDFDREIIEYFHTEAEYDRVGGRLSPKDDPAPATLVGTGGADVSIWGKWINGEAIGPAGERGYFSIFPGGDAAGEDHASYQGQDQYLPPSQLYTKPTMLEGRRCALYRIYRDPETGEWPSWQEHADSGESLVWVGSITNEGKAQARTWSLRCDGPSSWLRRQLGSNRDDRWRRAGGNRNTLITKPGAREDLFALSFWYQQTGQPTPDLGASSLFDEADDSFPQAVNATEIRTKVNQRIAVVSALMGPDIVWATERNAVAQLHETMARTQIDKNVDAPLFAHAAIWTLSMHEKCWRILGYDPILQQATNFTSKFEIKFTVDPTAPGKGYYKGEFWTVPIGQASVDAAGGTCDNGGAARNHLRLNTTENPTLLSPKGGELSLGVGTPPYWEGQTNRPPGDFSLSGGVGHVDATGYIALRGSYKTTIDGPVQTLVQVAKISWKADTTTWSGDTIQVNDKSYANVYIERFLDPRLYGCDCKPLSGFVWATNDLEVVPVSVLGHELNHGNTDLAHRVLLNMMLSTGTASWSGWDGQGAVLTPGANAHPDNPIAAYNDTEVADLGLAIPWQMIDAKSFGTAAGNLSGGIFSPLNRSRLAWIGAIDSQELIRNIIEPRGWGMGFNRGRFRLFAMSRTLIDEDVEVVLGPDDFASDEAAFVESVNLRPAMPREKFGVDVSRALVPEAAGKDVPLKYMVRARDVGARTRKDNGGADVEAWGLPPRALWRGDEDFAPPSWETAYNQLWGTEMANWYNSPFLMLEGLPLMPSKARLLGPGTIVRITSLHAPTREGVYGITNKLGRVFKVRQDLDSGCAYVDILVQPGTAYKHRRFGPMAWLIDRADTTEERHDPAARTVYCYQDYFRSENPEQHDVRYFAEPATLGVGGDALVHGWQHNGRTWEQTFSFVVESVSQSNNSITYKPGSLVGKIWESRYGFMVMAPWDLQAPDSWPRALFAVITKSDGTFGAGPTKGFKLS